MRGPEPTRPGAETEAPKRPLDLAGRLALRPNEAADALGVSSRTLRKWMRDDGLPFLRLEGVVLIPCAGLERWMDERMEQDRRADAIATEMVETLLAED